MTDSESWVEKSGIRYICSKMYTHTFMVSKVLKDHPQSKKQSGSDEDGDQYQSHLFHEPKKIKII